MKHAPPLLLALLLTACDQAPPAPEKELAAPALKPVRDNGIVDRKQAGLLAPDAPFRDSEGEAVTLADFKGGPVLLNLWATWCAPCVAEMPTLDALAAREAGKLSVITLSEDSDDDGQTAAEKIDAFFDRMQFRQLGAYLDADSTVMTQLGVSVLPTTILYDAAGREVWRVTGELDWTGARAAGLLREGGAARR
ncbi:MAG TPA: TlpA disulfide reductase family protein [Sphingomonadaceae bacterium]|nr:TlpA disulfide reductase family protein [Sphingomonadaceae bacterium]